MIFACNYEQLIDNARYFNEALSCGCSLLISRLSSFRRWYYFPELDMFAPSKFIGYQGMTCEAYRVACEAGADGRETETHLHRYFHVTDATDERLKQLIAVLVSFEKATNCRASILVITRPKK